MTTGPAFWFCIGFVVRALYQVIADWQERKRCERGSCQHYGCWKHLREPR